MSEPKQRNIASDIAAVILASAMTLILRGYQFGQSNHTVYLLDALRVNHPELFKNDWYVTHTYQYHFVFTYLTALLDRLHILRPAFLIGYLALILGWQFAWLRLCKILGGDRRAFIVSVILFLLSASGFGLGFYDFLQDSAMLPSNIANVLMLGGIVLWMDGKQRGAAILLGLAGLIHLNDAVIAVGIWVVLAGWSVYRPIDTLGADPWRWIGRLLVGTAILLALCLVNIIPAYLVARSRQHLMPLEEFVSLYVRLRHPHHYDPSSWPLALWISFLWPLPITFFWIKRHRSRPTVQRAALVLTVFFAIIAISLVGAGVWYVSETLIQMSLSRFSIYPKLITCTISGIWVCGYFRRPVIGWIVAALAIILLALRFFGALSLSRQNSYCVGFLLIAILFAAFYEIYEQRPRQQAWFAVLLALETISIVATAWRYHAIGFQAIAPLVDPPEYLQVCEFARLHTPTDAVFLVPPEEESFRLVAQRAIVINFKGVPQFDGELVEWRNRLQQVLDLPTLTTLPHRFDYALQAIGDRYAKMPDSYLIRIAKEYGAGYLVLPHAMDDSTAARLVFENGKFYLYDLSRP